MSDIKHELYRVADDFASHMRLLDILKSEGEDTGPLEQIIAEYFTTDVTREKIDSVIGYIRYCDQMQAAAQREMERLKALVASWGTQRDWLKDTVKGVLEMSGQKRLEGLTAGSLTLRANGGRPAVQITDASLLPEEFVQYTGTISGQAWGRLKRAVTEGVDITPWINKARWENWEKSQDVQMERIPHKGRIGEALSKDESSVPGARLEPRGSTVVLK